MDRFCQIDRKERMIDPTGHKKIEPIRENGKMGRATNSKHWGWVMAW
jgi:hypothetical protein